MLFENPSRHAAIAWLAGVVDSLADTCGPRSTR
jgi:hypothetical protein